MQVNIITVKTRKDSSRMQTFAACDIHTHAYTQTPMKIQTSGGCNYSLQNGEIDSKKIVNYKKPIKQLINLTR